MAEALFRRGQNAQPAALVRAEVADRFAGQFHGVPGSRNFTGQRQKQFVLTIAGHTAYAQNLAFADLQVHVLQRGAEGAGR